MGGPDDLDLDLEAMQAAIKKAAEEEAEMIRKLAKGEIDE